LKTLLLVSALRRRCRDAPHASTGEPEPSPQARNAKVTQKQLLAHSDDQHCALFSQVGLSVLRIRLITSNRANRAEVK